MADIDVLPPRGVPALALVDSTGIATNGSQTVAQLAARGIRSICAVDATGVSVGGASVAQLASAGIRSFCPVDENGVSQAGPTADALRRAGIRPMVLLGSNGLALTGSATVLTLAQRGLSYFCPLDEAGNATTMGAVILVTNTNVLETATIGTNVGTLSVAGGTGTYTFSLTDSAGGKFTTAGTNGTNLNTAAALDFETATSHSITISATNGGTPITRTVVITVINVVEDTTPDAFTFTDVTGAALSTLVESNAITVSGIDGPVTLTITGGQYSVNGGTYASTSTSVIAGATVKVRGTSSASNSTAVNVVLTIGGVSDTFTITTAAGTGGPTAPVLTITSTSTDNTPEFTIEIDNTVGVSDSIRLQIATAGTSFASPTSDTNHTITAPEDAANSISLSLAALADANYEARSNVTDAGVTSAWSNVVPFLIGVPDSTPNAFTFTDVTGAALSTVVVSNTITVTGINVASVLTITGGEYSINGGTYASTSTTVVSGNTVTVRGTSSGLGSTAVNVVLTIGGVSDTFTITTAGTAEDASTTLWADTYVPANGGTVGATRRGYVDTFIKALKAAGLWTTLDRYWLLAGENAGAAKTDLKTGAAITPVSGWSFATSPASAAGYTGNGTSSYGDTGVDLSTFGGQYAASVNSGMIGCQIQNNRTTDDGSYAWGALNSGFTTGSSLSVLNSGAIFVRMNDITTVGIGNSAGTAKGSWTASRITSATVSIYRNGTPMGTDAETPVGISPGTMFVGATRFGASVYAPSLSTDTISAFYFGSGWSAAQVANFETIQNAMMTSIGINVH